MRPNAHRAWRCGNRPAIGRWLFARLSHHKRDRQVAQFLDAEAGGVVPLYKDGVLKRLVVHQSARQLQTGTLPWTVEPCAWGPGGLFCLRAAPYSMLELLGVRGVCDALRRLEADDGPGGLAVAPRARDSRFPVAGDRAVLTLW